MQFENNHERLVYLRGCVRELLAITKGFDECMDGGAIPTQSEMRELGNRAHGYAQFCGMDAGQSVNYSERPQQVAPPQQQQQDNRPALAAGFRYLNDGTILNTQSGEVHHPETGAIIGVRDVSVPSQEIQPRMVSATPGGGGHVWDQVTSSGVQRETHIPKMEGMQ